MTLAFDHAVIAVANLEVATANFRSQGFTVESFGQYPDGGPRSACIALEQGGFLELSEFRRHERTGLILAELGRRGEGLADFALRSADLPAVVSRGRAGGLPFGEPVRENRACTDGEQACWMSTRQPSADMPSLVGDVTPRSRRVPDGDARRHLNGSVGVESFVVAVLDVERSAARYRALLGEDGRVESPRHLSTPGLRVVVIRLGKTDVVLAAPEGRDAPKAPIGQLVRDRLERRGEGPVAITLRLAKGSTPIVFDELRTHGVPIDSVV